MLGLRRSANEHLQDVLQKGWTKQRLADPKLHLFYESGFCKSGALRRNDL
jgi:hypothetical protein